MPKGKFFCFSPPVMIATFFIEIAMAMYILWRYKATPLTRLVVLLFAFLAIFQLAEYMVCGGMGMTAMTWSRIGFVAITMLPPLGVHIVHAIAGRKNPIVIGAAYLTALACILYFALAPSAFAGQACLGNYVIFQLENWASWIYRAFYYGWVLTGIGLCLKYATEMKSAKLRTALRLFACGYAAFIIPTTLANLLQPDTLRGVPSIMCGFAVLMALITTFGVLPLIDKIKHKRHTSK